MECPRFVLTGLAAGSRTPGMHTVLAFKLVPFLILCFSGIPVTCPVTATMRFRSGCSGRVRILHHAAANLGAWPSHGYLEATAEGWFRIYLGYI